MSINFKDLGLPLQKVIELGEVDRWLRGVAKITPRPAELAHPPPTLPAYDANTHTVSYSAVIRQEEIEAMVGFRKLLQSCAKNNIRINLKSINGQTLEVCFVPTESFSKSSVFGASYANVLPLTLPRLRC